MEFVNKRILAILLALALFVSSCAQPEIVLEPTLAPATDQEGIDVADLELAEPGRYSNIALGYRFMYPAEWHTGFGERPVLVSLSNLDPGNYNRESIRTEGCLIEARVSTNVYGYTLQSLQGQLPSAFRDVVESLLDGEPAYLVADPQPAQGYYAEHLYATHEERMIVLSMQQGIGMEGICQPAWDQVRATWEWFVPEVATYRNSEYGFALSYPRQWFRFNSHERGIWISSTDPSDVRDVADLALNGMLVEIDVDDNAGDLDLQAWLLANSRDQGISSSISLDGLRGVRMLSQDDEPGIQEMAGYYLGPLGRLYTVRCRYPLDRQWEFRPIANGILYSWTF
jgi:hypothetical protein